MSRHYGDFDLSTNIHGKFTTVANATSLATALNNGNLIIFKDNGTANSVAGLTLTANFNSLSGYNHWNVNTAANATFFSAGSFFDVVLANGTVGGSSVANYSVGSFTLRADSALKPTTAGRTFTVDAGGTGQANVSTWLGTTVVAFGAANGPVINGINSGNITASVVLTGNITGNMTGSVGSVNTTVGSVTGAVGSVTATVNANVTHWLTVAVQQLGAANGIVVNGINAGNVTATVVLTGNIAGNMTGSVGSVNGNVGGNILGNMNGNVGGNVIGTVASVIGAVGSVTGAVGSVTGAVGSVTGNVGGSIVGTVANVTGTANVNVTVLEAGVANQMANAALDLPNGIETALTWRQAMRYTTAAVAGNLTGGNTTTVVINSAKGSTTRLTATVDADGNTRTLVYG